MPKTRKKPFNPARQIAINCWLLSVLGLVMIIYPLAFPIETYGAGYALEFGGVIVFFTLLISGFVFARVAAKFDAIFSGKGLLAHWTYSPEEWARYTEVEHRRNTVEKWHLFYLIAGIAVVIGTLFSIFERDAWKTMLFVIPGLIAFIAVVALFAISLTYRENRKYLGEVYIGTTGVLLNRAIHYWKLPASFLHSVTYEEGEDPYIDLEYSAQSGMGRGVYAARIPVPRGHEDEAREVVARLKTRGKV